MVGNLFKEKDIAEIRARGAAPEEVSAQIEQFRRGFPFAHLDRACTVGDGITLLDPDARERMGWVYSEAALAGRVMKFVPASGAASRMFKSPLAVLSRLTEKGSTPTESDSLEEDPEGRTTTRFIREIRKFAFFPALKQTMARDGLDPDERICAGDYRSVLEYALTPRGLNLSNLPKGLIPFHAYPGHARTAVEEHLAEAALYAGDREGRVRIHFTVSAEHKDQILRHIHEVRPLYEKEGVRFEFDSSVQEPSTDTVAVDGENLPFRDDRGSLVFRPGGHGALLGNLESLKGDVVFIKNIDNVAPDRLKGTTIEYKKALGGFLVELQGRIFSYLQRIDRGSADRDLLREAMEFMRCGLHLAIPAGLQEATLSEMRDHLLERLNRPLRVCGMVRNEGEPGGGPFWVRRVGGTFSPQIVESSQVDMRSKEQRAIWESSTHFNPVDLVCGLTDFQGRPFRLRDYRDPDTGFISVKSKDGRELKALELPGLWNGSMAFWNTVFVEVPSSTFSPVKTVLDLLRSEHQPEWRFT
jgi:hypothetical protein